MVGVVKIVVVVVMVGGRKRILIFIGYSNCNFSNQYNL